MNQMLKIENLNVNYSEKHVLQNLNLELNQGIHGIVGLNGAGKTTFFRTLFGLKKLTTGEILFEDQLLKRQQIALLETENFFYSYITGREHLALFQNENFDLETWNKLFKLPLDERVDNYSTGMKKKLSFLATIKQDRPLMILDEPFNGIDLESTRSISSILKELAKEKTILISSHVLSTLTEICDTIHYLYKGNIQISSQQEQFGELEQKIFSELDAENQKVVEELFSGKNNL